MTSEEIAYWFFRLNGCATITNFVLHRDTRGPQKTEFDIVAVRFPFRLELPGAARPMEDHTCFCFPSKHVRLILAEVTAKPCKLNPPWTDPSCRNMQRVLSHLGVVLAEDIEEAAESLYRSREFKNDHLWISLFCIGTKRGNGPELQPPVVQLLWEEVLGFIYSRMRDYRRPKADKPQWDETGQRLYGLAQERGNEQGFIAAVKKEAGLPGGQGGRGTAITSAT